MECFFFLSDDTRHDDAPKLTRDYECEIWTPTWRRIKPADLTWFPFTVWWIFHWLHIFKTRRYAVLLIRKKGLLVHHSCIFPKYLRFPFMSQADLQIGNVWTIENERGKGIAAYALNRIINGYAQNTRIWYLTESSSESSIRVAKKSGFRLFATGKRNKRLGLNILGCYSLDSIYGNKEFRNHK